jgi:hypothetical protein
MPHLVTFVYISDFIKFKFLTSINLGCDDDEWYDDSDSNSNETPACPVNEVSVFAPPCPPEETCSSYLSGYIVDCARPPPDSYTQQCRCEQGLVRNANGECVNPNSCCEDPNAEVVSCPNPCPGGTCDQPTFAPCRMACKLRGCQCKKGFVKNSNGKCIRLNKCPAKKCTKKNQVYMSCGTRCPATCANQNPVCILLCVPGCFCKQGFVLHNGQCIEKYKCPRIPRTPTTAAPVSTE